MADDWTNEENDAAVADYFALLAGDIAGECHINAAHNRALRERECIIAEAKSPVPLGSLRRSSDAHPNTSSRNVPCASNLPGEAKIIPSHSAKPLSRYQQHKPVEITQPRKSAEPSSPP